MLRPYKAARCRDSLTMPTGGGARVRLITGLCVLGLFVACSSDPVTPSPESGPLLRTTSQETTPQLPQPHTDELPAVLAASLSLEANGSFTPNTPITVTATVAGHVPAPGSRLEILALDLDPATLARIGARHLAFKEWTGDLTLQSSAQVSEQLSYGEPGYYRVVARLSVPAAPRFQGNRPVLRELSETIYLFVHPTRGGATEAYDPTLALDSTFALAYGAYGPIRPLLSIPRPPQLASSLPSLKGLNAKATVAVRRALRILRSAHAASGLARLDEWIDGTIWYFDESPGVNAYTPVRGGVIYGSCYGMSFGAIYYDLQQPFTASVNQQGNFGISCPAGYDLVDGSYLMNGTIAHVRGPGGVQSGLYFSANTGQTLTLYVTNSTAAHVFRILEQYIPQAFTKFGSTRPWITVWAAHNDPTYPINYCSQAGGPCLEGGPLLRSDHKLTVPVPRSGEEGCHAEVALY